MDQEPEVKQLSTFLSAINSETDRGVPLTAAAMLDERLYEILNTFLVPSKQTEALLSGFNAPLGIFSARISASYSLGLIGDDELEELQTIRKIRNKFAHNWKKNSFNDDSVKDLCKNLPWRGPSEYEVEAEPRSRFNTTVAMLLVDLMWRVRLVDSERRVVKSWPNRSR